MIDSQVHSALDDISPILLHALNISWELVFGYPLLMAQGLCIEVNCTRSHLPDEVSIVFNENGKHRNILVKVRYEIGESGETSMRIDIQDKQTNINADIGFWIDHSTSPKTIRLIWFRTWTD